MVGNWVDVLGPVVAAGHAESAWPQAVVLDSTWFDVTNRRTGTRTRAFYVLAFYGYQQGARRGRVLALRASARGRQADWEDLLRSLPGKPTLAISDGDPAITGAVSTVWPATFGKVCEHHLEPPRVLWRVWPAPSCVESWSWNPHATTCR